MPVLLRLQAEPALLESLLTLRCPLGMNVLQRDVGVHLQVTGRFRGSSPRLMLRVTSTQRVQATLRVKE